MAFVIKFVKGVRNHWKKSTFAAFALVYGANWAKEKYEIKELMRVYCEQAAIYGHQSIPNGANPRTVTIILNPNANKRKAADQFENYCAPILNLAGICVDIVKTESEGHAKNLIEKLKPTDAIIVAGGDGTLSEVITGLLRHCGENKANLLPVGVLPLGSSNTVGKSLFPGGDHLQTVRSLADASLAIIEEVTKPIDVMKIEVLEQTEDEEATEKTNKPVYAVAGIEWGAYRDANAKKDKYWYFGPLRRYVTYLFNGYKSSLTWNCEATIQYSLPCRGCSNCHVKTDNPLAKKWYHRFIARPKAAEDFSGVINESCRETHEKKISTADLALLTTNAIPSTPTINDLPKLQLQLGPEKLGYFDFVIQGWDSEKGKKREVKEVIEARQIEIKPTVVSKEESEHWFSIDREDYEVKPVRITLIPKIINMFVKKQGEERGMLA